MKRNFIHLKDKVETLSIKNWNYERFVFQSRLLKQDFHCGLLRSNTMTPITKSLYVLHGGGADDSQAAQAGLLPVLADILSQHVQENIQVVFPFIGGSFLHDHPSIPEKSFSNYFLQELLPACEEGTTTSSDRRFICGWSMGGQAALNIFLRFPENFGGVGAHFPTLVNFDYTDQEQQNAYSVRQKVGADMMKILVSDFQKEFIDLKDFANHNPLLLAKNRDAATLTHKKIYFDVGQEDEFGLVEGALVLHELLLKKNVAHQFEVVPLGKHDGPFIHARMQKMLKHLL